MPIAKYVLDGESTYTVRSSLSAYSQLNLADHFALSKIGISQNTDTKIPIASTSVDWQTPERRQKNPASSPTQAASSCRLDSKRSLDPISESELRRPLHKKARITAYENPQFSSKTTSKPLRSAILPCKVPHRKISTDALNVSLTEILDSGVFLDSDLPAPAHAIFSADSDPIKKKLSGLQTRTWGSLPIATRL